MRSAAIALLALVLAPAPAFAQKACYVSNENIQFSGSFLGLMGSELAVKVVPTQNLTVTAFEWYGRLSSNNATIRSVTAQVWDQDAITGGPGTVIATGTLDYWGDFEFYPARLTTAVQMNAGSTYFVGMQLPTGSFLPLALAATTPGLTPSEFWLNRSTGWSGPTTSAALAFRLHCGTNTGTYFNFGTGQTGSVGVAAIVGLGFPNLGNPIRFQIWNVAATAPAVVFFGLPGNVPTPFGALLVDPILLSVDGLAGSRRSFAAGLSIPTNPALTGVSLVAQGAVVDAASSQPFGIVLSDGLQVLIGN